MKIVIAGAGDVGFHLAELLSFENQDIILIDINQDLLDYAATHLDVLTIKGDSSSIEILENAEVWKANLVIAVTTSEKTNLITAILAKKMGARQTIARVSSSDYLEEDQKPIFKELGVDSLISPRQLAAKEIQRLVDQCSFTDVFEFENGKISLVGITLNQNSILINKRLKEVEGLDDNVNLRPIAILRGHQTIIPRGDTYLLKNDHVYFIARKENIEKVEELVGGGKMKIKNIMILGGTGLGFETAKMLEKDYNVTIIEKKKENCKILSEHLDHALVINGDGSNIGLLEEEGLRRMDAFLALTPNSETNIIASLTAKNYGVFKTIAQVENREYTFISQDIGVDTLINKKLIAANNIFRFVRKGRVEAITSLHGVDAEVIEFVIQKENRLTKKPLRDLKFPKTALVGGVIRGNDSLIPTGDFQFQVDDKVIIFALPEAISKVEQYFR
jgi:trk system potassium uptake protein TrkA